MNFWDNRLQITNQNHLLSKITYFDPRLDVSQFERLITFSKIIALYEIGYFNKIAPLLFCYSYSRVPLFNSFIENIFLLSHFFVSMYLCKILHQLSKVLHNLSKVLHKSYGKHYSSFFTFPLTYIYNKHITNPVYVFYNLILYFFILKIAYVFFA